MVERAMRAADELAATGVDAEVIDLRWLRPLDIPTVITSVAKTRHLVIAEEQVHAGGWGATVISGIIRAGVELDAPPQVVGLPDDLLIPYCPDLEDAIVPSSTSIVEAVRGLA
jgi:pyruvate/2-oxoglutarate/acetoin dehydrogenase E1 component